MALGIDYGNGLTNIDHETGIRYGVIHAGEVGQAWYDSSESDYGDPHCPKCGNEVKASTAKQGKDYRCRPCKYTFWSDEAYGDTPICHTYAADGYEASQGGDDCDIFVTLSPFYTYAPFCSPCAPGAGYLGDAEDLDDGPEYTEHVGVKTYCFGHDWFEDNRAPYRVFRVSDDSEVLP